MWSKWRFLTFPTPCHISYKFQYLSKFSGNMVQNLNLILQNRFSAHENPLNTLFIKNYFREYFLLFFMGYDSQKLYSKLTYPSQKITGWQYGQKILFDNYGLKISFLDQLLLLNTIKSIKNSHHMNLLQFSMIFEKFTHIKIS